MTTANADRTRKQPADRLPKKAPAKKAAASSNGQVFDATAAYEAARAEYEGQEFRFTLRGVEAVLPHPKDWGVDVTGLLASGQMADAMESLLTPDEWKALNGLKPKPRIGEIDAIFRGAAEWAGVETLGN